MNNHFYRVLTSKATRIAMLCLSLVLMASNNMSFAAIEEVRFEEAALEKRYQGLIAELRCLVCQNQNLADSDASLAKDLRKKTEDMLKAGKSDQEILSYMSDRYGEFVLYRPPFSLSNALLWVGPFVLLLLAATALLLNIRKRQRNEVLKSTYAKDESKHIKVRNLLNDAPSLRSEGDEKNSSDKPNKP